MKSNILVAAAIIVGGTGAYLYFNPDILTRVPLLGEWLGVPPEPTTVFRWQDHTGGWQYTQTRPREGVPYEQIEVPHDVNVLPLTTEREGN